MRMSYRLELRISTSGQTTQKALKVFLGYDINNSPYSNILGPGQLAVS